MAVSAAYRSKIATRILLLATILFILSLFLPSISLQQNYVIDRICMNSHWEIGLNFFVLGPLGIMEGQFGWYANPLMLVAVFTRKAVGAICALLAVALTIRTAYSVTSFWRDGQVPDDVCGFGPGYYVWVVCSVLVLVATLLRPSTRKVELSSPL